MGFRDIRSGTIIDAVMASLVSAAKSGSDSIPPAAILWADEDRQWAQLVPLLKQRLPQLLTLGNYNPGEKSGPVIWIKAAIAGALPDFSLPHGTIPILYLPGVSRQSLRSGEDCPEGIKPLVELQFRGVTWAQRNGKDWTVDAFFASEDTIGLDLARDARTRQALLSNLVTLAEVKVADLVGRRIDGPFMDHLVVNDPIRDLLKWMSNSAGVRATWDDQRWAAFQNRCRDDFQFNPTKDGELTAGEKFAAKKGRWADAWKRFEEMPEAYLGVAELLRKCVPADLFSTDQSVWPSFNDKAEEELRKEFEMIAGLGHRDACAKILALEEKHGLRRQWVWARLGLSPLANTLEHLAHLAQKVTSSLGGETLAQMAEQYSTGAYTVDLAAIDALTGDGTLASRTSIESVLRTIYLPWLQTGAERFQALLQKDRYPDRSNAGLVSVGDNELILFVDGLRFDLAQRLVDRLKARSVSVQSKHRWAALPTVTATAKPAVSPIAEKLKGNSLPADFIPAVGDGGGVLRTERFRSLMQESGYTIIPDNVALAPNSKSQKAWSEFGHIDADGHALQIRLVDQFENELDRMVERIVTLIEAGWVRIRVVTDHGWLLMPGGLPKVDLPSFLTEIRWSRCAVINEGSSVQFQKANWHWNSQFSFAFAPGIACFKAGTEYSHGGISIQECLIPDLLIEGNMAAKAGNSVGISSVQWLGLRCRVTISGAVKELFADVRTKPNAAESSIAGGQKSVDAEGRVGLIVENEDLIGTAVVVVLLDRGGQVIAKRSTMVGGDE